MTFPLGFAENSIQLVPDGTLLLHVLIILVMVYVLNATLFRPINRILEARDKRTRGRLTEARKSSAMSARNSPNTNEPCGERAPKRTHFLSMSAPRLCRIGKKISMKCARSWLHRPRQKRTLSRVRLTQRA